MPERVVINIEVNSDVATIEATREALRRLRDEQEDYNRERDRGRRTQQQTNRETQRTTHDSDALGNSLRRQARNANMLRGRYAGLLKETFALRRDIGGLIGAFGGLIKFINKMSLIEIPLLAAGLSTITMLFKMGPSFIKLYKAAMSGLAYTAAGAAVAIATAVAAQREFQSVQFAPMYSEGANNTADRFIAASQAMQMFTGNTRLAVVGAESLQKAFGTLSKQKAVTGNTVAAFEGLMNVVAGSGGDIGKGSEKLAEFLAKVQKSGLGGAGDVAKELGPDFEKIIKEAQGLGIKTSDEFFKAAAEGTLGKTFQDKYAGQLDALNNTLIGRFKIAMSELKNSLVGLGDQFLEPAGDALDNMVTQLKITIARLSPMLSSFGPGFLQDIEQGFAKMTNKFVEMMNKYLNTTPTFIEQSKKIFNSIGSWFDGIQDWARQFVPAGQALIDNFFKPVWEGLTDKFSGGINTLSELVLTNTDKLRAFAADVVGFIAAIGDYGNMLKEAFIAALPLMSMFLKGMTKIFEIFTKLMKGVMRVFGSMGDLGKAIGAIIAIYASLTIFGRFFKTLGGMFGKDMNVRANNVFVNGAPMGGMPVGGRPGAPLTPAQMSGRGYMTPTQRMQSFGRSMSGTFSAMPIGGMASTMLGGGLLASAGDTRSVGGALKQGAGIALMGGGMLSMMGGQGIKMPGGGTLGASGIAGGAAIVGGSYAAGNLIGSQFKNDTKSSKAMSAGASAVAGAAIGAAVGSVVPIIGTGVGAAIGAVVGGISGWVNSGKQQKAARKMGQELISSYTSSIEDAFAAGDLEALTKAREDAIKQNEENLKNVQHLEEYNKHLDKFNSQMKKFDKEIVTYTHNANLAERAFDIGTDQLNKLANEAGINLRGRMLNLVDVIKLAGKTTSQQVGLMKQEWAKLSGLAVTGIFKKFQDERDRREAGKEVDAAESKVMSGIVTPESIDALLESATKYGVATFGEFGGIGSVMPTLMEKLTTGSLKDLTSDQKEDILTRATGPEGIFTNEAVMASIVGSEGGQQLLKDVTGATGALAGKTPMEIQGMIMARMNEQGQGMGGFFLGNLQTEYEKALKTNDFSGVNKMIMGEKGYASYTAEGQDSFARSGRAAQLAGNVPAPAVTTINTTLNFTGPMDERVIARVASEIEKINRTARERGAVPQRS